MGDYLLASLNAVYLLPDGQNEGVLVVGDENDAQSIDGDATVARFNFLAHLAISGDYYWVVERSTRKVRRITPGTWDVASTVGHPQWRGPLARRTAGGVYTGYNGLRIVTDDLTVTTAIPGYYPVVLVDDGTVLHDLGLQHRTFDRDTHAQLSSIATNWYDGNFSYSFIDGGFWHPGLERLVFGHTDPAENYRISTYVPGATTLASSVIYVPTNPAFQLFLEFVTEGHGTNTVALILVDGVSNEQWVRELRFNSDFTAIEADTLLWHSVYPAQYLHSLAAIPVEPGGWIVGSIGFSEWKIEA